MLATADLVRERIASVEDEPVRKCLALGYLLAGRVSEIVGRSTPNDNARAVGPTGESVTMDSFEGREAYLFTLKTEKRGGRPRTIGLPGAPDEPWTKGLWEYCKSAGSAPVFPFTRQMLGQAVQKLEVFRDLEYEIDQYDVMERFGEQVQISTVKSHLRSLAFHGLRHVRLQELRNTFHFLPLELAAYAGWSASTASGVSMIDKYAGVKWFEYFPKLLQTGARSPGSSGMIGFRAK